MSSTVLYGFAEKFLFDSKNIEKAALFDEQVSSDNIISLEGGNPFKVNMKCTDGRYWDFFPFKFIKGKGYSQDDIKMKLKRIVISKTVSKRLFGDSDPVGKTVLLTYVPCIVSGFVFFMRAKNKTDEELYVKELKEKVRKFNATSTDNKVPGTDIELEEDVASSSGVKINPWSFSPLAFKDFPEFFHPSCCLFHYVLNICTGGNGLWINKIQLASRLCIIDQACSRINDK